MVVGNPFTITTVSREHTGDYICTASNGIPPSANQTIKLQVQCKYTVLLLLLLFGEDNEFSSYFRLHSIYTFSASGSF